jgi:hypothetical protein
MRKKRINGEKYITRSFVIRYSHQENDPRRMRWTDMGEKEKAYGALLEKPEGNTKRRWVYNIKMDLK